MFQKIKIYLQYGNYFCGIEHTSQNSHDRIYATILKKKGSKMEIERLHDQISINDITSKLPKKQHVFLIINNDNVLTKCIKNQPIEDVKLVYNAFPNINLDDFFYEVILQQKQCFVSICRRTYIETLILEYRKNNISIINISLGSNIVSSIIEYLDLEYALTSNTKISIDNKTITSIENTKATDTLNYDVNGLTVRNDYLISFSGAINSLLSHFQPITNLDVLKQSLRRDYNQSQFYMQFLKFGLVLLLVIVVFNFIAFNHYYSQVDTLQKTFQSNQETKQRMDELSASVNKSQKIIEDILKSSASKSSFYVDAIIQISPNSILLSELNFQPVIKNIKEGVSIEILNHIILVSGESNNSELFSKFINDLEKISWIKKVEVLSYENSINPISNFSIKLTIHNER